MGRERDVLRWDVHHWLLARRLDDVEAQLAGLAGSDAPPGPRERDRERHDSQLDNLLRERAELQQRLQALGPSPRAKMG
jgi:hypothetical protein